VYRSGSKCSVCHPSCLTCDSSDPDRCLSCPPFIALASGVCDQYPIQLVFAAVVRADPLESPDFDLLLQLTLMPDSLDIQALDSPLFWRNVSEAVQADVWVLKDLNKSTPKPQLAAVLKTPGALNISIGVKLSQKIQRSVFFVVALNSSGFFELDGVRYRVRPKTLQREYTKREDVMLQKLEDKSPNPLHSFNELITMTSSVLAVAAAVDPTGLSVQTIQTVKLASKLLFFMAPYGDDLKSFLERSDQKAGTYRSRYSSSVGGLFPLNTRGQLSRYKVLSETSSKFLWKMIVYVACHLLRVAWTFISHNKMKVNGSLLLLMHHWPSIHLIVFNTFSLEFLFYFTHTILHSSFFGERIASAFVLTLVILDLLDLTQTLPEPAKKSAPLDLKRSKASEPGLDASIQAGVTDQDASSQAIKTDSLQVLPHIPLSQALRRKKKILARGEPLPNTSTDFTTQRSSPAHRTGLDDSREAARMAATRAIDYEATYAKMRRLAYVRRQQIVYKQYVVNYLRVAVYFTAMISMQYAHAAMVVVVIFELAKMSVCTALLVKKKYYRHWLMFVYDNQQSLLMTMYFLIQLVKPNDSLSIQLVTVGCLMEYVGLLICVGYFLKTSYAANKKTAAAEKNKIHYRENYEFIAISAHPTQNSLLLDADSSLNASAMPGAENNNHVFKNRRTIVPGIDSRIKSGVGLQTRDALMVGKVQSRHLGTSGLLSTANHRSLDRLDERL